MLEHVNITVGERWEDDMERFWYKVMISNPKYKIQKYKIQNTKILKYKILKYKIPR